MLEIKIKSVGILKKMSEQQKPMDFAKQVRIENRQRIVAWACNKVENLVKLERYAEAERELNDLGDNIHMWAINK